MLIIQITQVMKVPGHSSIIQNQSNARFGGKKNYPEKKKGTQNGIKSVVSASFAGHEGPD